MRVNHWLIDKAFVFMAQTGLFWSFRGWGVWVGVVRRLAGLRFWLGYGRVVSKGYAKSGTFGQARSVFAAGWFWVVGR